MIIQFKKLLLISFAVLLTSCSSVPTSKFQMPIQLAEAAAVPVSAIQYSDVVRFSDSSNRERFVQFKQGAYAQTRSQIILFQYDKSKNSFREEKSIPLAEVRSVAVATRGAFQHLKQLQIEYKQGFIALNFSNYSDAEAGYAADTDPAILALEKVGLKVNQTDFWFIPEELRGFRFPIPAPK